MRFFDDYTPLNPRVMKMHYQYVPYIWLLLVSALVTFTLAIYALRENLLLYERWRAVFHTPCEHL